MSLRIVRLCRLYNVPARAARPASKGKPAQKARPARKGIFDASKSYVLGNMVARSPDDTSTIPGTNVKRAQVFSIGGRTQVTTEAETDRVVTDLQRWHAERKVVPERSRAAESEAE